MSKREDYNDDSLDREALRRLSAELRRYVEKRIELIATEINSQFSLMASMTVLRTIGGVVLLFGVLFLLFALARYLGELLNNVSLGFLLASIPLLIAGIALLLLRPRRLLRRIRLQFFRQFMEMVSYITPQNLPEKADATSENGSQSLKKRKSHHD